MKDENTNLFFDKTESGDEEGKINNLNLIPQLYSFNFHSGKVTGKFSVLLANGRLLTVSYVADREDGFVPRLSFKENADPFTDKEA